MWLWKLPLPERKQGQADLLHLQFLYTGKSFLQHLFSTKAAIVNFVQAIAQEWDSFGIRINCINPERTKTPMRVHNFGIEPENTLLSARQVAEATLLTLASDYTGQVIDVKRDHTL